MKNEDLESLDLGAWPIADEYLLIELGRVFTLWASLENLLGMCIGKLAGFDDRKDPKPLILVNHTSFPQKLDILSTLCEQLVPDFPNLSCHKTVVSQIRAAQKARNRFAHNVLAIHPETGETMLAYASARGTLKSQTESISPADLRRVVVRVHEAQLALYKLVLGRSLSPVWERRPSGTWPAT